MFKKIKQTYKSIKRLWNLNYQLIVNLTEVFQQETFPFSTIMKNDSCAVLSFSIHNKSINPILDFILKVLINYTVITLLFFTLSRFGGREDLKVLTYHRQ